MTGDEPGYLYQGVVDWQYRGDPRSLVEWRQTNHMGTAISPLYNLEERALKAAHRIARRYTKDPRFRAFPSVERFPVFPTHRERRRGVVWLNAATAVITRPGTEITR